MISSLSIALLLSLSGSVASDRLAQEIAPFLNEEVAIVVHADLESLDVDRIARPILGRLVDETEVGEGSGNFTKWVTALKQAGAKDLYILVNPVDMPGPPIAIVPFGPGADANMIGQILCGGGKDKTRYSWPTCATIRNAVFAGTTAALDRARRAVEAPRSELKAAFAASVEGPIQVLFLPSPNQRRILDELIPILPKELGGGPGTSLTRGLLWASITLEMKAKPTLHMVFQSKDADAAHRLIQIGTDAVKLMGQPDILKAGTELVNDRIVIGLDLERAADLAEIPYRSAMDGSERRRCVDNLKQIGLALHNYHSTHGSFPPSASRDKQGRPLLSWRVHILPFLDQQQTLFNEFHLDEPWDSAHNKPLVAKMPTTYINPKTSRKLQKSGKTTYLVPVGKSTIFTGGAGIKINEVTDGTSNTIMAVDASDALAVEWTKPEDWTVDPEVKKDALFGHYPEGAWMLFADGSARFIKQGISLTTLNSLLTRNGREILKEDGL